MRRWISALILSIAFVLLHAVLPTPSAEAQIGYQIRLGDGTQTNSNIAFGNDADTSLWWTSGNQFHIDSDHTLVLSYGGNTGHVLNILDQTGGAVLAQFATCVNAVGTNCVELAQAITIATMNGSDTVQVVNITPVMGAATGTGNTVNLLNFAALTGDAESNLNAIKIGALTATTGSDGEVETAINIGAGWDYGILNDEGTILLPAYSFNAALTNGFYNTTAAAAGVVDLLGIAHGGNDLGAWGVATGTIAKAAVRTLNATPVEVIAAPGAGFSIVVESMQVMFDYGGTQYNSVAGGEDLRTQYASSDNQTSGVCDNAICIGAAGAADSFGGQENSPTGGIIYRAAEAVELTITNGEWATVDQDADGNSVLHYIIRYRVVKVDLS